jgi:H+/Cl- antiporter ClcA
MTISLGHSRAPEARDVFLVKWLAIGVPSGAALLVLRSHCFCGRWIALRRLQWQYPWLLYLLPHGRARFGIFVSSLRPESAEAGNNLIMEQTHEPGGGVPARMAPLVLVGTLITHLFGGSAGREGTAVQMGGSIVATLGRWLKLSPSDMRILLTSGIAAGFGAVFGTPLTGAIFAIEVLTIGRMSYQALIPCLIASIVGDQVNTAWGVGHTQYHVAWVTRT